MKSIIICLLLISRAFLSFSQLPEPSLKPVKTKSVVKLLGSIDSSMNIMADNFAIQVFLIGNPPGSAMQAVGHEISHNLLINVAEYDEHPNWKLFSIGSFINPKISKGPDFKDK
ncbi:MAG TPA: hypothetical protein VGE44_04225 [Daejeonella sp.]|jgi:hypothetical protein|uniref:hypothetical protein n=1 Tax=Daejeonella sp. TaxID=2805397 RepID=UPI002EDA9A87